MDLQKPNETRRRTTPTIGSAAGGVTAARLHERASVAELFAQYEALVDARGSDDEKHALAQRICGLLAAREWNGATTAPRVARTATPDGDGDLDDGEPRVATAQELIERIGSMQADDASTPR
jgi:hypothetical protein